MEVRDINDEKGSKSSQLFHMGVRVNVKTTLALLASETAEGGLSLKAFPPMEFQPQIDIIIVVIIDVVIVVVAGIAVVVVVVIVNIISKNQDKQGRIHG